MLSGDYKMRTEAAACKWEQSPMTTDLRCFSPAFLISATSALSRKVTSTDPGDRYIYTDSWSGQFSMVAGSYSSFSSKTLMLPVSYFTSSGQRAKLSALGCVPSLPFVCVIYHSIAFYWRVHHFFCLYTGFPLSKKFILSLFSPHPVCLYS